MSVSKLRLRSEQIYQAMVDDEAFAALPSLLAQSLGARSCTIHWRDTDNQAEILAHSGYFADAHMMTYAKDFTAHDDWTNRANQPEFINRVWNAEQLVPARDYADSIFYNEWIKAMGDDTFHCMGTVMETGRGLGIIGLHRGRSQRSFDDETVAGLRRNITHLRRMLTVRARLVRESERARDLAALLDCNPAPMFALSPQRRLVHANAAGQAVIASGGLLREVGGRIEACRPDSDATLHRAVAQACNAQFAEAGLVRLAAADGRQLELTLAPVSERGANLVLVTGRDPDGELRQALAPSDPRDTLAPRELMVARLVGVGLRNREIAERLGLTEGTVKVYLHNLYAKVGVSSRTELALRIGCTGNRAPR